MAKKRLLWLSVVVILWAGAILAKLVLLQLVEYRQYRETADALQVLRLEIPAPRGTIFDRSGQPLAMSVPVRSVYVNPLRVPDLGVAASIFSDILHMDRAELYARLKSAHDNRRGFLWIKRRLAPQEAERLRGLPLDWIGYQEESQRQYPNGTLAAHLLGSVDFQERGNAGIERACDAELRGLPGKIRLLTDVKRRGIESELAAKAREGAALTLSIHQRIQFVAERELEAAVRGANARTGSVVVMNPYTGDILALASYPTYDPGRPPQPGEDPSVRHNNAVSVPFEPGSVFKVITLAAALECTPLRPETIINCGRGPFVYFGRPIREAKNYYGALPMELVLAKSSNIGAIQVGLRVGPERLHDYIRLLGFGQRTGVQLPAESSGVVRRVGRWTKTSICSVAMGQEISTTTLQLAQACAVVANGGLLVRPRLILRRNGQAVPPETPRRVLRPETAITMRRMMEGVVLHGTGRKAAIPGYSSGGKTGSAQIFDTQANRFTHSYNASFMGFAPVANPAIVAVVTINGTHGSAGFGGAVAAPVFRAIATEALRVLDIPRDIPDPAGQLPQPAHTDDLNDLPVAGLDTTTPHILLDSSPDDPTPPALHATNRAPASAASQSLDPQPLTPNPRQSAANQAPNPHLQTPNPRVPDFHGMTMRAVLAEAAARGLPILPDGSGVARMQYPPPGSVLQPGERIRVRFAR